MRGFVIFKLIKEDWKDHARLLSIFLISTLILDAGLIWAHKHPSQFLFGLEDSDGGQLGFVFAVFMIPYAVSWVIFVSKLKQDLQSGYYALLKTFPVAVEELLTAKFVSTFTINAFMNAWLYLLWTGYQYGVSKVLAPEIWAALYFVTFIFPIWLALHRGLFFHRHSWGTTIAYFFWIPVFLIGRSAFGQNGLEKVTQLIIGHPFVMTTSGIAVLLLAWVLVWRWALQSYRTKAEQ
ncbi:hypothetical protein ACFO4N_15420 [Camelliibacillus cellulosilyticus]|uniref:ABC-2 type transport system permease protein n=1 Tax=Camelliibacillus cellulosilyticus TaxID=2174486 RepID=A0ABV9GQ19_9BACL